MNYCDMAIARRTDADEKMAGGIRLLTSLRQMPELTIDGYGSEQVSEVMALGKYQRIDATNKQSSV